MGEKWKAPGAGGGKPGAVDGDVSNNQSCIATETHQLRSAKYVVSVSQPGATQAESSQNHLTVPVILNRRGPGDLGLLQLSKIIIIVHSFSSGLKLSRGCGDVIRIQQSCLSRRMETSGLCRSDNQIILRATDLTGYSKEKTQPSSFLFESP